MQSFNVLVIGSGAAGYAAADRLLENGVKNIALVTEGRACGTSRNAGSDKQTYYKLSCTDMDSPMLMAQDLSFGGSMHKDTAYIEASNSLRCFLHLADYGVPFPEDEFGRFVGYKTDHDSASRGTTSGPLTSKFMTECLERRVLKSDDVTFFDKSVVIKIVEENNKAVGIVALKENNGGYDLLPIKAKRVILATGGAAGIYRDSVYPLSQSGALGLAVDAGCALQNVNEWQYGIASIKVRWNLSGSYQQVIPMYYSEDEDGTKHDFLNEYFSTAKEAGDMVFLKGYQWPFDSRKVDGSSRVDLAVNEEVKKGRKVFMDFRANPNGYDFDSYSDETKDYLISANAVADTPIERLEKLNKKAIEFYKSKGIDLYKEPLEIAVCAQHMNGGVMVDTDWQTSVENLFTIGEAAGTFGVYRPGGSALNSTQVGALRAAQKISRDDLDTVSFADDNVFENAVNEQRSYIDKCLKSGTQAVSFAGNMSEVASHCRIYEEIKPLLEKISAQLEKKYYHIDKDDFITLRKLYKYNDSLLSQKALCETLVQIIPVVGSRGGSICMMNGKEVKEDLSYREKVIATLNGNVSYPPVRDYPNTEYNFEVVWNNDANQRKYK